METKPAKHKRRIVWFRMELSGIVPNTDGPVMLPAELRFLTVTVSTSTCTLCRCARLKTSLSSAVNMPSFLYFALGEYKAEMAVSHSKVCQ